MQEKINQVLSLNTKLSPFHYSIKGYQKVTVCFYQTPSVLVPDIWYSLMSLLLVFIPSIQKPSLFFGDECNLFTALQCFKIRFHFHHMLNNHMHRC